MENFDVTLSEGALPEYLDVLQAYVRDESGWVGEQVEFRRDEVEGMGIFAKCDIAPGETLMRIPIRICISVDLIMTDPVLNQIVQSCPVLFNFPDEILALGLMYSKNFEAVCSWSAHTKTFPATLNSTIFWTEEDMAELKGCNIFHLTALMKKQIERDWENVHQPLAEAFPDILGSNSIELYTWALSMIYSRAIGIVINGNYIRCIPPLLDLANHSPDAGAEAADTFGFDESTQDILMINTRAKRSGDECFVLYGPYPNSKLAYTYGFVIPNSPHRAVDLWTKVSPSNQNADLKMQILQNHDLTKNQTYDFAGTIRDKYISPALLATIRVIQATSEELQGEHVQRAFEGKMLSVRNEEAAYRSLAALLTARMRVETAEADRIALGEMLLDGCRATDRRLMALVIRVDERELLTDCLALVNGYLEQLQVLGDEYSTPDADWNGDKEESNEDDGDVDKAEEEADGEGTTGDGVESSTESC